MICTGRGHEALRHTGLALGSCYSGCDQRHNSARVSGVGGLARARGGTFFRDASRHRHGVFGVLAGDGYGTCNSRGSLGRWVYGPNAVWKPTRQVGLVANLRGGAAAKPARSTWWVESNSASGTGSHGGLVLAWRVGSHAPCGNYQPSCEISLGVWESACRVEISYTPEGV